MLTNVLRIYSLMIWILQVITSLDLAPSYIHCCLKFHHTRMGRLKWSPHQSTPIIKHLFKGVLIMGTNKTYYLAWIHWNIYWAVCPKAQHFYLINQAITLRFSKSFQNLLSSTFLNCSNQCWPASMNLVTAPSNTFNIWMLSQNFWLKLTRNWKIQEIFVMV